MQIDWWTLGLQTVNFLIVVWLLSRFLYQPIRRVIEEREAADRKAAEAAEGKARAADEARTSFESKQEELADTLQQDEARLHAEMEKERRTVLDAAEKKADDLVAQARERIARERTQALEDLADQIAALAGELARKALGEGPLSGDGLLDRVTTHLDRASETDLADLKSDLSRDGNSLSIATAGPLSDAEQVRWRDAMAERFDGIAVKFETDPELLGGAELRFPHAVLSFTVADRLKRAAKELKAG